MMRRLVDLLPTAPHGWYYANFGRRFGLIRVSDSPAGRLSFILREGKGMTHVSWPRPVKGVGLDVLTGVTV